MPELRQNIITRDWVIISTERAKRPDQFAKSKREEQQRLPYDPACPFCAGNESLSTPDVLRYERDNTWTIRIVPNKFPALQPQGTTKRRMEGIYRTMDAFGFHEVIIEYQKHDSIFIDFTPDQITEILSAYRERYSVLQRNKNIESIIIFRNHGKSAGTSLLHPHSQIVAMPIVPFQIRARVDAAMGFFDDNGECVFCRTLRDELQAEDRLIEINDDFAAFIPYAALSPFHIWIFPRRHSASFNHISAKEIKSLAKILKRVLLRLHKGLNNPDYNFTIRSIPTHEYNSDYYHWYLAIIPRLSIAAGFELGSGMFISSAIPEDSARFLREVAID